MQVIWQMEGSVIVLQWASFASFHVISEFMLDQFNFHLSLQHPRITSDEEMCLVIIRGKNKRTEKTQDDRTFPWSTNIQQTNSFDY